MAEYIDLYDDSNWQKATEYSSDTMKRFCLMRKDRKLSYLNCLLDFTWRLILI